MIISIINQALKKQKQRVHFTSKKAVSNLKIARLNLLPRKLTHGSVICKNSNEHQTIEEFKDFAIALKLIFR